MSSLSSISSPVTVSTPGFSGVSKFASSLQQVLSRAESIASLPLQSLEAAQTTFSSQQSALQGLDSPFFALQQSVVALQQRVHAGLLNTSISDGSILGATVQSGASAGTYSVEVTNLGSYSTAVSSSGAVSDPQNQGISSSSFFNLSVGAETFTISPASTSLADLAKAINTQANGKVQAALVNVGSSGSSDYRLSLRATSLGAGAIDLTDSQGGDLISTSTAGSLASYTVNGSSPVESDSRSITLAPGLTANLLGQSVPGQKTTVTVANDPSTLESALSTFVQSYNSAVNALAQQHGQNAGALQGDSLLQSLAGGLNQLGTYSNGSPSTALANYGITLDKAGQLSLDTAAFTNAATANFNGLLSTLGDSSTGGFLQSATSLLNGIEDPITGSIKTEESTLTSRIASQQTRIDNEQTRLNQLQANITAQIARADSAIAALESRVSYVTGLFATYTGASNTQSNGLSTL